MGSASTEVREVETEATPSADAGTSEVTALRETITALEAKVKALEEGAVAAVKEDVRQIASFLRSKYPYSL